MPASQTRSVSYRIGEAASGGMGAISQPANQSESAPGQDRQNSLWAQRVRLSLNCWHASGHRLAPLSATRRSRGPRAL